MDKLIELLDEYEGEEIEHGYIDGDIRRRVRNFDNERNTWHQVVWETKRFGFIKWLVDNDKIDHNINENPQITVLKVAALDGKKSGATAKETREIMKNGYIDALIMLLAIQENPIEFLISILK